MRHFLAVAALLATSAVAAAPRPEDELPAAADLIALAFPKWSDDTDGRLQSIAPARAAAGGRAKSAARSPSQAASRVQQAIVTPAFVLRAAPGRYVLPATLQAAGDDGAPELSQSTPAGLAAYTFTTSASGWKLLKRQEPFDRKGYEGEVRIEPVRLSDSVQGVVAEYGSCWQGKCGRWISVYAVSRDGVQPAAMADVPLAADNIARPECAQARRPEEAKGCFRVEGRWHVEPSALAPGAFVIDFGGEPLKQGLRYQWRGARYEAGGASPVPKIE